MKHTKILRLTALAIASAVIGQMPAPVHGLPIITAVVETGGDDEATDTITAKFTGETFVTGVANEPVAGKAVDAPYTAKVFGEDVPMFVDRTHQWNGASTSLPLPKYLVGGEYIMSGNDNRDNAEYKLEITISAEAFVYMLVDNRLGEGNNANPPNFPDFMGDRTSDGIGDMEWLLKEGWKPMKTGYNRASNPDWPDEVGADEGGDGVGPGAALNQWSSVYVKRVPAGKVTIFAPDNNGQNMYGVVITAVPKIPTVTKAIGDLFGVRFEIADAGGISITTSSVVLTLDGTAVTPQVLSKSAGVTKIEFTAPTRLAAGSTHAANLKASDTSTPPNAINETLNFTVEPYGTITRDMKVTADTTKPGFKARVHQIAAARTPGDQNSLANALSQLAGGQIDPATGQPYPNEADLSAAQNGVFTVEGVVNWEQGAVAGGNFTENSTPPFPDALIPGIPGINGSTDNIVAEVVTFLELPAGLHRFGVNSDDGFLLTAVPSPQDVLGSRLGVFDGGRGFADTVFSVAVEEAGIYPVRLVWWEGGGGAGVELFTVDTATNQRILVNDRSNPKAIKAYRDGQIRPYIKSVTPGANAIDVALDSTVEIVLADGSTQVQANSVKLSVNGQPVTATVSKPAGSSETKVTYKAAAGLPPDTKVAIKLEFSDNATPPAASSREYTFSSKPDIRIIFAIDDKQMWRYENTGKNLGTAWKEKTFNDSSWPQGAALLALETGAVADTIRTDLVRVNDAGEQIVTDYFRTRFNFTGDPAATRLRVRHVVDDGFIMYMNGTEIYRFSMPAGVVGFQTLANGHENSYDGPFEIPASALVAGENVIAVEVHQSSTDSSDIVFGLELQSIVTAVSVTPPKFSSVASSGGNFMIIWTGTGTLQSANAVTGPWTDVPNAKSPFSDPISGGVKFYRFK